MSSNEKRLFYKSILGVLSYALIIVWLMLNDSNALHEAWGKWIAFHYQNAFIIITVALIGFVAFMFKKLSHIARLEQFKKDSEEYNKNQADEKEAVMALIDYIEVLAKSNDPESVRMLNKLGNLFYTKSNIARLKGFPEVGRVLLGKIAELTKNRDMEFDCDPDLTDLSAISYISGQDMKFILENIIDIAAEGVLRIKVVSILIREDSEVAVFEFVYHGAFMKARDGSEIDTARWFRTKQLVHKYNGEIEAIDIDEGNYMIQLRLPYRKVEKTKVIKKA